jgi:thiol-disulfide isomerase/thioredoxin
MLKNAISVLFISIMGLSGFAQQGIQFNSGSFEELKAEAAKTNKIIFMDAYATWCGPCKWMAAKVFTDDKVGAYYNANFVNAKVDMEKGEGIELAKQFQVTAYPTLLYIDAKGNVVHRGLGARDVDDFIALGNIALDPSKRLGGQLEKYQAGNRQKDFLFGYVKAIMEANMPYEQALEELYKQLNESEILAENSWELLSEGLSKSEGFVWDTFIKYKDQLAKKYGEANVTAKAEEILIGDAFRTYRNNGNIEALTATIKKAGITDPEKVLGAARMELAWRKKEYTNYATEVVNYFKKFPNKPASWLNHHAWNFYEQVENKAQLQEALKMAKKAVEMEPSYAVMDTYAALLYKTGNSKEALVWADKAIAKGKTADEDVSGTEELKQKIKQTSTKK